MISSFTKQTNFHHNKQNKEEEEEEEVTTLPNKVKRN
jgi:hypothetical protein